MGLVSDKKGGELYVKNIFLFFLILPFAQLVWGDSGVACPGQLFKFDQEVLIKSNCPQLPIQNPNKRKLVDQARGTCACLREQIKTNDLLKSISETAKVGDDALEASKKKYRERFFDMYEKMTVGASVQAKILGLENDLDKENSNKEKIVGCTPSDVSRQVNTKAIKSLETQLKDLKALQKENLKKRENCSIPETEECIKLKITGERIQKNIASAKDPDIRCSAAIKLMLEKMKDDSHAKSLNGFMGSISIPEQMFFSALQDLISKNNLSGLLEKAKVLNLGNGKDINCSDVHSFVSSKYDAFKESEKVKQGEKDPQIQGEVVRISQCEENDSLCQEFESKNNEILEETKEKYSAEAEDCITQAEFDTFKAMPSEALLNAIEKNARHPGDLLILPKNEFGMTEIENATTNFLRSNPIIAKMALDKTNRKMLGEQLQNLAKSLKGKDGQVRKYKAYLNFMKNDVREMAKNSQKMNASESFVCDKIASSFTAIEIANDLPFEDFENDKEQTLIGKLQTEFKRCDTLDYQDSSTTDLFSTLNQNPIFNLGLDKKDANAEAQEFKDLKTNLCADYPSYVTKECNKNADDKCRMNYLAKQKSGGDLPEIVDQAAQASIDANQSNSIKTSLDQEDMKDVSRYTDESQQDHEYKAWWNQNVGSKMDQNVMARPGHYDEFEKSQRQNESIAFSAKAPESLFAPIDPVASNNSNSNANAAPQAGQQVPEYAKDIPSFDPSKLASATSPKDLIPNYDSLAPSKQKESLTQVKEYIASKPNSPISEESVDEEISSVNKKIAANIKTIENKIEKISSSKPEIASPNMNNGSRSVPILPMQNNIASFSQPFVSSNSNSTGGSTAKLNTKSQSAQATNKALIQANESRDAESNLQNEGRSPASLLVQDTINFQKGVFDPALLAPGILINEEILVPDSHDKYEKIKTNLNDLKLFLSEQIDPKSIKDPKIYRIKDPKESPNSYILFYVSKGASGEINVKTVNRKSTLRDLNNTL